MALLPEKCGNRGYFSHIVVKQTRAKEIVIIIALVIGSGTLGYGSGGGIARRIALNSGNRVVSVNSFRNTGGIAAFGVPVQRSPFYDLFPFLILGLIANRSTGTQQIAIVPQIDARSEYTAGCRPTADTRWKEWNHLRRRRSDAPYPREM